MVNHVSTILVIICSIFKALQNLGWKHCLWYYVLKDLVDFETGYFNINFSMLTYFEGSLFRKS